MSRLSIPNFELANPLYRNASVSFYTVVSGVKTAILATLYSGASGSGTLANPQKLNSKGRFKQSVYIADAVIGTVEGISVPSHDTGVITPAPTFRVQQSTAKLQYSFDGTTWFDSGDYIFRNRGAWATATDYVRNDIVLQSTILYVCLTAHTSNVFATDLAAAKWFQILNLAASSVIVIDTIAALKALAVPSTSVTYLVRGYYAVGDGGGGHYWWNSADATADNGGTVIALDVGGAGRFNLLS